MKKECIVQVAAHPIFVDLLFREASEDFRRIHAEPQISDTLSWNNIDN